MRQLNELKANTQNILKEIPSYLEWVGQFLPSSSVL